MRPRILTALILCASAAIGVASFAAEAPPAGLAATPAEDNTPADKPGADKPVAGKVDERSGKTDAKPGAKTAEQKPAEPKPAGQKPAEEKQADAQKAGEKPGEKSDQKSAADQKATPQRFIPSEQVRADFDVSFPIDI